MPQMDFPKPFSSQAFKAGDCPSLSDLGKQSRELFETGFPTGLMNLKMRTKLESGMEVTSGHDVNLTEAKVISSQIQSKLCYKNASFTSNVSLEPKVNAELKWKSIFFPWAGVKADGFWDGSKHECKATFGLMGHLKEANIECLTYCDRHINDYGLKTNLVAKVYGDCFVATTLGANIKQHALTGKLLCGYQTARYSTFLDIDPKEKQIGGTSYYSLGDKLKVGVVFARDSGYDVAGIKAASVFGEKGSSAPEGQGGEGNKDGKEPSFALCADYMLQNGANIKLRVNNKLLASLACKVELVNGLKAIMCAQFNAANVAKQGIHKIGLGLEF